ncbi:MAG: hypothetical protein PHE25_00830 [Candidatus Gracilibacteria bacterium]|nr:hypothetical protein [Candidatus Gracilibacteria bacterium]
MSDLVVSTNKEVDEIVLNLLKLHLPIIKVDVNEFLDLLKNSLSLNVAEKKRVVDAVPTLSQFQFDELKKVFVEEREKFRELAKEHPEDIKKLLKKQQEERLILGGMYKNEEAKKEVSGQDEQKIDDIKKSLGL